MITYREIHSELDSYMVYAEFNGFVIGVIGMKDLLNGEIVLGRIHVKPEWRGKRIGPNLLNMAENWARTRESGRCIVGEVGEAHNIDMATARVQSILETYGYIFVGNSFSKMI